MSEKDCISIIIPIYKVEKYLKACVDSVRCQSYRNLEIILVDDGSPDECPEICDEYAKDDKRIKVIHKKNGGLSDARNVALKQVSGRYVFLLDGDDTIHERTIEFLYENIRKNNADIATCNFLQFDEKSKPRSINLNDKKIECLSGEEALSKMLYQKDCTNIACAKLYKKELFGGIEYPKGELYEDLATTYKLFGKAKTIVTDSRKLYNYRQRTGSIVNNTFSLKHLRSLDFAKEQTAYVKANYPDIIKAAYNREFMEYFFILYEMPKKQYPKEFKDMASGIKRYRKIVLKDKESPKKPKLIALLSYIGIWTIKPTIRLLHALRRRVS